MWFSCDSKPSGRSAADLVICGPKPISVFRPVRRLTRMPRKITARSGLLRKINGKTIHFGRHKSAPGDQRRALICSLHRFRGVRWHRAAARPSISFYIFPQEKSEASMPSPDKPASVQRWLVTIGIGAAVAR